VADTTKENPTWGQERIAAELWLKLGVEVSPRTVARLLASRVRSEKWEEDQFTALADIYTESYSIVPIRRSQSGERRNGVEPSIPLTNNLLVCYEVRLFQREDFSSGPRLTCASQDTKSLRGVKSIRRVKRSRADISPWTAQPRNTGTMHS
jgi:hypothetical protein